MTPDDTLLREKAFDGLRRISKDTNQEYVQRLEYELSVVRKQGFAPYFLVMWDIVRFARANKILYGPGRGSGAGSLLNYCLQITLLDPIKYNLYFERFLNPDRVSPPDIDWDCAERDRVIEYLEERYGRDRVCRVGSVNFLRTKSAIRDIGRALEVPFKLVDDLCELVPPPIAGLWDSFEDECKTQPRLLERKYALLIEPVSTLWGVARSYGTHAGGVAIAPGPLNRFVPLYKDKDGNPISQFDWRDLEAAGLLKFDILGLSTLEVIQLCLQYLKEDGIEIDLDALEDGDGDAYNLIRAGDLDGVFQLGGSESIKQLAVAISPRNIDDLSLITSLFRPGPLSSGLMETTIKARQGELEPSYSHESLRPILEPTHGACIYQEQVMQICTDVCGYTKSEADNMRKILGKKLKTKMVKEKPKFVSGAVKAGMSKTAATQLFSTLEDYAKYLFNRSHALAYSRITYQTAYLKAHHPVHFYAALLAKEKKPDMIIQYASSIRSAGITLLPPNINCSGVFHQPEGKHIRMGLTHIKGMPSAMAEAIVKERERSETD